VSKSFLELLENLQNAENHEQKVSFTSQLSFILEEDEKYSERMLQSYFTHTLGREVGDGFQDIIRGEYFVPRVKAYLDDDYTMKVALGLAYLQDYRDSSEDLDLKVLQTIELALQKRNLDLLVNDISVNDLQRRNGEDSHLKN
jgi:hypothetical protein